MKTTNNRMLFASVAEFRANLKAALDWVADNEDRDVAIYRSPKQRFLLFADTPGSYNPDENAKFVAEAKELFAKE